MGNLLTVDDHAYLEGLALTGKLKVYGSKVLTRVRYVARIAYWTTRHRSIATARWVVAFEGLSW